MNINDFQPLGEPKKRGRKSKKQHEKELIKEYRYDNPEDCESNVYTQKKIYENMQHLSTVEKQRFDQKFTKPKNGAQRDYYNLLGQRTKKIVVATGPAGTGKTLFATEMGVKNFLTNHVEKIIFTRPSVTVDEDLGYLPGTLEEKMAPWVRPIYDILYTFISPKDVGSLIEEKTIEISPLGFMRGRTFKRSFVIADEMQNSSPNQMLMLATRLGEQSRMVITGDLKQSDRCENNGLLDLMNKLDAYEKPMSEIKMVKLDQRDVQRSRTVSKILRIYGDNSDREPSSHKHSSYSVFSKYSNS